MRASARDDVCAAVLASIEGQLFVEDFQRHRPTGFQFIRGVDRLPALPQQVSRRTARTSVLEVRVFETAHLISSG